MNARTRGYTGPEIRSQEDQDRILDAIDQLQAFALGEAEISEAELKEAEHIVAALPDLDEIGIVAKRRKK